MINPIHAAMRGGKTMKKRGRPKETSNPKRIHIFLESSDVDFLIAKGGISSTIRALIAEERMKNEQDLLKASQSHEI